MCKSNMRKVLVITYHFPPYRTGGVYRHLKFAKYLSRYGWYPYILTAKNPSKHKQDLSLMKDIPPSLPIYLTYSIEPDGVEEGLINLKNRFLPKDSVPDNHKFILFKIINKLLSTYLLIPDDKVGWLPHTILKSAQLIKRENIDSICTTSPPHSTHLIGLLLKKIIGIPWIADFRDPWSHSFMKRPFYDKFKFRYRLEKMMEGTVLAACDRIITVSKGHRDNLLNNISNISQEKIKVITNGFDDDDFEGQDISRKENDQSKFLITHIGRVYPGKSYAFLACLKNLIEENSHFARNIVVSFVGHPSNHHREVVNRLGLAQYVRFEGFHDRNNAIKDMLSSDLLLLMVGEENNWIPGKLFEYLRAKKPIFVIGEEGDATRIAQESGLGIVVSPKNIHQVKEKLLEIYQKKMNGDVIVKPNHAYINTYNRTQLTSEFAGVLNDTTLSP